MPNLFRLCNNLSRLVHSLWVWRLLIRICSCGNSFTLTVSEKLLFGFINTLMYVTTPSSTYLRNSLSLIVVVESNMSISVFVDQNFK